MTPLDEVKALLVQLEGLDLQLIEAKATARRLLSLAYQTEDGTNPARE